VFVDGGTVLVVSKRVHLRRGRHMLKQYQILTCCLTELKSSGIPTMEKLKLEVQLIQTKRILLDHEVKLRVSGVEASEAEFNDLYNLVRLACKYDNANNEVDKVNAQLQEIMHGLNLNADIVQKATVNKWEKLILRSVFGKDVFD
jgi:hypothetical protein